MKSFKPFLLGFLTLLVLTFFSCKNIPNSTPTSTYTEKGDWQLVTDSVGGLINVQQDIVYVTAAPSWGQSFHYAFDSGYTTSLAIGIILILIAVIGFTLQQFDDLPFKTKPNPYLINIVFFAILAFGAYTIYHQPGDIRWNNDKAWPKTYYDNVIKTEGSTQRLWDSLEVNNRIVFASYKK